TPEESAATALERHEEQAAVLQVLGLLRAQVPERNVRVFEMRWIEGRTVEEVAAALGLTAACVRWRAHRTKRAFERLFRLPRHEPDREVHVKSARPQIEPLETRALVIAGSEHLVTAIYPDLLHRPVDAYGLANWSRLLDEGVPASQVVREITKSSEYRTLQVQ